MFLHSARKRKSDQMDDEPATPKGSPVKKMRITQAQKQALIDNLQLEISERARQLRAQYALQCSDLRSRIERRINRVPISLRKRKMGELMAQHEASPRKVAPPTSQPTIRSPFKEVLDERPLPALPSPSKLPSPLRKPAIQSQKTRKRKSSAILIPSDKENHEPDVSDAALDSLPVQKNLKRAKTAATVVPTPPKRAASRTQKKPLQANGNPTGVLSPRSHNSRTLVRSPIKEKELPIPAREASPLRQQPPPQRPASPSKIASPFKAATSALSSLAKRGYAAAGAAGARLTRPISREKEQATLNGTGTTIPSTGSPTRKMLPPPRPALATLTSTSVASLSTASPQRTASQASIRSNTSEQSSATNATVVTKSKIGRGLGTKKAAPAPTTARAPTRTITTTTTATKTKGKVVVSGSTVSTLSPKATNTTIKRAATTAAAAKKVATGAAKKMVGAGPTPTGRVLRKRN
ncbi:hypothetical protein LTR05_003384 [Lithohypha guttulata]|uniref:Borealin N-terminal domain-containing protein n=1 Tax=Lithohypha guttulata TaxID=1690604 RepID=A0AAN7YDA4_9EURO|nr:hypothetical protein LTR05_003384 [Lithohypha guttulata]